MNTQPGISGYRGWRAFVAIAMLSIACVACIETAEATSVFTCKPESPARADKMQVEDLAKSRVAPGVLDEAKSVYCMRGTLSMALLQSEPVRAADGAFETSFVTCRRERRWECDLSRERAIDVVEGADSATVRVATRNDFPADELRELYSTALKLAGSELTAGSRDCAARAEEAQSWRTMFLRSRSRTIDVSKEGPLFNVERSNVRISFAIEKDANGVKTAQYRCIVRWPGIAD